MKCWKKKPSMLFGVTDNYYRTNIEINHIRKSLIEELNRRTKLLAKLNIANISQKKTCNLY